MVQRCSSAWVDVTARTKGAEAEAGAARRAGSCPEGLLVYLGVGREDGEEDAAYLADKVANLRIFMDAEGKMNLSLLDLGLGALVVSQFTLFADARKGRRPSYSDAASGGGAEALYELFCAELEALGVRVERGEFGAMMRVGYVNEGPVTILLDSKKLF